MSMAGPALQAMQQCNGDHWLLNGPATAEHMVSAQPCALALQHPVMPTCCLQPAGEAAQDALQAVQLHCVQAAVRQLVWVVEAGVVRLRVVGGPLDTAEQGVDVALGHHLRGGASSGLEGRTAGGGGQAVVGRQGEGEFKQSAEYSAGIVNCCEVLLPSEPAGGQLRLSVRLWYKAFTPVQSCARPASAN